MKRNYSSSMGLINTRNKRNRWSRNNDALEVWSKLLLFLVLIGILVLFLWIPPPPWSHEPTVELGPNIIKANTGTPVTVYVNDSTTKGKGLSGAIVQLSGCTVSVAGQTTTTLPEISPGIYRGTITAQLGDNDDDGKVFVKVTYKDFEVKLNLVVVK